MSKKAHSLTLREMLHSREVLFSFFRSYIVVLIIPLLLSLLYYYIAITETQNYAIQLNNSVLNSASEALDLHLQSIGNFANEIISSAAVQGFQYNKSGFEYPHSWKMNETRNSLNGYSISPQFIDRYFLFFNNAKIVMNNIIIYTYEDFFRDYLSLSPQMQEKAAEEILTRSTPTGLLGAQEITMLKRPGRYISLMQPLLNPGNGYLCILIREEDVSKLFEGISLGQIGCIYVMNGNKQVITQTGEADAPMDDLIAATMDRVLSHREENHYLLRGSYGEMLVNHKYSPASGLTYVSVQPMSIILQRVNLYRNMMLLFMLAAVVIGFWLCVRQARRSGSPVVSLMNAVGLSDGGDGQSAGQAQALQTVEEIVLALRADYESFRRLAAEHKALLQSSFISRLLHGGFSDDAEAARICRYVCPEHSDYHLARVLLLRLDSEAEDEDLNLKLTGSMKVALKEVLGRCLPDSLTYDTDEKTLAVIVFDKTREEIDAFWQLLLDQLPPQIRNGLSAYGGVKSGTPLPKIARSFDSARNTMTVHLLGSSGERDEIAWADKRVSTLQFFYPTDVRYRLIDSVLHGNSEDVKHILEELFHINFVERPLQTAVTDLFLSEILSTALSCLPLLPADSEEPLSDETVNDALRAIRRAPLMNQRELVLDFYMTLTTRAERNQNDSAERIRQVIEYLNLHYSDSSLSLSSIAESFRLNASVLSTTFKQQTGKNLSAYLEDLRIQAAQRLLRTTNWTINHIAEEVGYLSANSFCRAFRRNTGYNTSTYKTMVDR